MPLKINYLEDFMRLFGKLVVYGFVVLSLIGCVTDKGVYDASVPEEQQCRIEIEHTLTVTEFDGVKVPWKPSAGTRGWGGKTIVSIPAGEHTLTADYYFDGGSFTRSASGLSRTFDFQPQCVYRIVPGFPSSGMVSLKVEEL
jgi:hypothetical protein